MIVLVAGHGRMGKLIEAGLVESAEHSVAGIIDIDNADSLDSMGKVADVIIDFSNPGLIDRLIAYAERTKTPLVSGTTGLEPEHLQ